MTKKCSFLTTAFLFGAVMTSIAGSTHDSAIVKPPVGAASFYRTAASGDPLPSKKFIFSIALTPNFDPTLPPISLYFEKGIAKIATLGIDIGASYYDGSYSEATILVGLRACGYVFPAISKFSGKDVKSFGFDPYAGLTYNYYITAINDWDNVYNSSNVGAVVGSRWYPGDKRAFALLAEFATSGIRGSNFRVGISLGR